MHPNLFRRTVATLIDLAVVVSVIVLVLRAPMPADLQWLKVVLAILIPLLYEPVLSAYACTVGQALMWTRVRDFESLQRIPLSKSYMRFVLKYIVSVVGAGGSVTAPGIPTHVNAFPGGGHRASHDLQAGTVVISAGAARKAAVGKLSTR
jgi:hypothetical protein